MALILALQILSLYAQRPIVEKHTRYALYHPSAEGMASMLTDMPYKVGFRRDPSFSPEDSTDTFIADPEQHLLLSYIVLHDESASRPGTILFLHVHDVRTSLPFNEHC